MTYKYTTLLLKNKETPMVEFLRTKGIDFNKLLKERKHSHFKLKSEGFMDLTVEVFPEGEDMVLSVCHYYEQNGDLCRDPEITYKLVNQTEELVWEDATTITQDPVGVYREVYKTVDGKNFVNTKLKTELQDFTQMWVKNLESQGHELIKEVE